MSVSIDVVLDIEEAEQKANQFQDTFVSEMRAAAKSGEDSFKKFADVTDKELKELANKSKQYADQQKQKWSQFANESRGFIGDVGDAVGALGKGLFGLSASQQLVADKTIYMTEKGAALGGALGSLLGPLGSIAGSAIGAAGGGLLGYFAGNSEAAALKTAELNKQIEVQNKRLVALMQLWSQADAAKKGTKELGLAWDSLRGAINDTINEEDLSKKSSKELTERKEGSAKVLKGVLDGIGKKEQEVANLETEISRIQLKQYDDLDEKTWLLKDANAQLAKSKEDLANVTKNVSVQQREYLNVTSELESRVKSQAETAKQAKEELKEFTKEFNTLTDTVIGFMGRDNETLIEKMGFDTSGTKALEVYNDEMARLVELSGALNLKTKEAGRIKKQEGDEATKAAEIEKAADTINGALYSVGSMAASAIGGIATDSFNSWLDAVATGEKDAEKSFKKIAASAVREIGTQLVADGVKNLLMGAAALDARLVAIGGAEVAAGVGMGAVGARAQRRQGFGDESNRRGGEGNLGRTASNAASTQVQAPSIINLGLLALTDQRSMEQAGRQIAHAQKAYQQGRR
jgi:hypothetical protein